MQTASEAGLGSLSSSWQGLFVQTATPRAVVLKLHQALNDALSRSDVKDALTRTATLITASRSPEEAQAYVVGETTRWARVIGESGVKPE